MSCLNATESVPLNSTRSWNSLPSCLLKKLLKEVNFWTRNQFWPQVICKKNSPPVTRIEALKIESWTFQLSMRTPLCHLKGKKFYSPNFECCLLFPSCIIGHVLKTWLSKMRQNVTFSKAGCILGEPWDTTHKQQEKCKEETPAEEELNFFLLKEIKKYS